MALIKGLPLKRISCSRTSSQSSTDSEVSAQSSFAAKTTSQSPMSLADLIATTYKHLPNLLIPNPSFLKLLKTVGAKSERTAKDFEIYTIQQLCFYLKEYIKERQLYDVDDVRTVYCASDPLRDVFQVDQFTINDALELISKSCTPLLKTEKSGTCKSSAEGEESDLSPSLVHKQQNELSPKRSSSSLSLAKSSQQIACKVGGKGIESSFGIVTSTTDPVRKVGLKRVLEELDQENGLMGEKRLCLARSSVGKDKEHPKEPLDEFTAGHVLQLFPDIKCDDFSRIAEDDFSDTESVYSVQSKETVLVKDSSDDLWFLKEDELADVDEFSDIYADEYDILSDFSNGSSSELEDDEFGDDVFEDVLETSDGSETEFADGEQSDADDYRLSQLSNKSEQQWRCIKCRHSNQNPDQLCDNCLNLRTEELLQSGFAFSRIDSTSVVNHESDWRTSSESASSAISSITDFSSKTREQELSNSGLRQEQCTVAISDFANDSFGIDLSIHLASSQESGFFSVDSEDIMTSADNRVKGCDEKAGFSKTADCLDIAGEASSSASTCIICLSEPKVASLIHGSSGHQVCCYQCALHLKRMRKPCPVCRRPIQRVIRNYVV